MADQESNERAIQPILPGQILADLAQSKDPSKVQLGKAFGASPEETEREMPHIASLVTRYVAGDLPVPSMTDFFAAQKSKSSSKVDDVVHQALEAIIASRLSPKGDMPERTLGAKQETGRDINQMLRFLGMDPNSKTASDFMREQLKKLSRTESLVLYQVLGTSRLIEFGFPNVDVCTEEDIADYFHTIAYYVHGPELTYGTTFTPIDQQGLLLEELCEHLGDRLDATQEVYAAEGYLPINARKIVEALLKKQPHSQDLLERIVWIAKEKSIGTAQVLQYLFTRHEATSALANEVSGEEVDYHQSWVRRENPYRRRAGRNE